MVKEQGDKTLGDIAGGLNNPPGSGAVLPLYVRILGVLGVALFAGSTAIFEYYVVMPMVLPVIVHQVEASGAPPSAVDAVRSFTALFAVISSVVGIVIELFIVSAVLYAIMRVFKVRLSFWDSLYACGNSFYINAVSYIPLATTPLLQLEIQSIISRVLDPALLLFNIAFALVSSIYVAYLVARFGEASFTRALVPSVTAFMVLQAFSLLFRL
jgi:hypothetical protein